ncbi:polysaccharide deacetylase family protein [Pseudolysinimonas yzui]|uniref:Polysaccharide deacetylase n=1 Tax=Pseudolysinimonas yzui TaxID=2708254 RepID=A0A8J3M4Q1_9MICO|nr:polysaccharide deacetylase family protein [Pseudolysinimonas yzui]GHF17559.1 polysaccharide deacetylase [Pseudolysinimonas yzui]
MNRRAFLRALGLSALGVGVSTAAIEGGLALTSIPEQGRRLSAPSHRRPVPATVEPPALLPPYFPTPQLARIPIPGGAMYGLPGEGNLIAFTIDDGASSEVVGAYAEFARRSGMRLTFFVTAQYPSWTEHAAALRPMVESGQVQMANHTFSHPDFLKSSDGRIREELERCGDFIRSTFGVEAAPYFRPPYGNYDGRVLSAARSVGYRQAVHWYGSVGDSGPISDANMSMLIDRWFLPQHIVIGHANVGTVLNHFDEIAATIRNRGLQPITLDDLFVRA